MTNPKLALKDLADLKQICGTSLDVTSRLDRIELVLKELAPSPTIPIIVPHNPRAPWPNAGKPPCAFDLSDAISPHDRSRCYLAARALEEFPNAQAFMWVDDDMMPTAEQIAELMSGWTDLRLLGHKAFALTGVYICRHYAERGALAFGFNPLVTPGCEETIAFGPTGGIHEATGFGFGFCIVSREVFIQMKAHDAEYDTPFDSTKYQGKAWFQPEVIDRNHLGEDRSFCYRMGTQGMKMFVDTRILVTHAGWKLGKDLAGNACPQRTGWNQTNLGI